MGTLANDPGDPWTIAADLRKILELNPSDVAANSNLGSVLQRLGKLDEAACLHRRVVELAPASAEAHYNLANVLNELGKLAEASESYARALQIKPDFADAYSNLGVALQRQERWDEAVACYQRALELQPDSAETCNNLGNALNQQSRFDDAIACYRHAVELRPDFARACHNLSVILHQQEKLSEAIIWYRRSLELDPQNATAYINLGNIFRELREFDEAADCYRGALSHWPDHPDAHFHLAMLTLLQGDFEHGWSQYEWRWKTTQLPSRVFQQSRWSGEPLAEKTILLHAEQGLGDTIQFVRYAPLVKALGGTVVVECQASLKNLLARCEGIDRLVAEGDALPPFHFRAPLLSLPGIFKTSLETIPASVPYLFADAGLVARWRQQLAGLTGFRIGINWHGRAGQGVFRQRDIALEHFQILSQLPDVRLIRLQKGAGAHTTDDRRWLVDLGDNVDTARGAFMDTAAIMMNLDLVITSDTAIAHLAGALGVPVWVALPYVPDWRWLLDRADSPWYPTMRLFRQTTSGDWPAVFRDIQAALRDRPSEPKS